MTTSSAPASTVAPAATHACGDAAVHRRDAASPDARAAARGAAAQAQVDRGELGCPRHRQWPTSPATKAATRTARPSTLGLDARRRRRCRGVATSRRCGASTSPQRASSDSRDPVRRQRRTRAVDLDRHAACRPPATTTSRDQSGGSVRARQQARATRRRWLRATTAPASRARRRRRSGARGSRSSTAPRANSGWRSTRGEERAIGRHARADGAIERRRRAARAPRRASAHGRSACRASSRRTGGTSTPVGERVVDAHAGRRAPADDAARLRQEACAGSSAHRRASIAWPRSAQRSSCAAAALRRRRRAAATRPGRGRSPPRSPDARPAAACSSP